MRCVSYSFADKIDLTNLEQLALKHGYLTRRQANALQLKDPNQDIICHYFNNGTLVCWSKFRNNYNDFLALAGDAADNVLLVPIKDSFSYRYDSDTSIKPHDYFNTEVLRINDQEDETKLSLAFGFSQSIKLKHFEYTLDKLIGNSLPIIQQLSIKGKLSISRKAVHQIIAQIVEAKSSINLSSDFFYPPKFFWQRPNLESNYLLIHEYLDISERLDALNQKINTLSETFSMLSGYLETRHSHFLEIIIIVLIAIEIIFSLLNIHF